MNRIALSLVLLAVLTTLFALGGARRFTYVYEATTSPLGDVEIENWVTWKTTMSGRAHLNPEEHAAPLKYLLTVRSL